MTYASEVLADSPLLYWRLGESSGTVAADASGNGRTGTYSGSPTLGVAGLVDDADTAVQFDGTNDYVEYADTTDLTSFTVEVCVKGAVPSGSSRYLVGRNQSANMFSIFARTDGKVDASVRNSTGTTTTVTSVAVPFDNAAHHIALVFSPPNVLLYIDGVLDSSGTRSGTLSTSDQGFKVGGLGSGVANLAAIIDEVSYNNTALSGARIAAHAAAMSPPAPITIHPNKITSTSTVHAPAIVPYIPPPVDGNITITAELTPATKYAACIEPDRSAQIEPARHVAGVNAT